MSCDTSEDQPSEIVAQVGPFTLSKERANQAFIRSGQDSTEVVSNFIKQWAYEKAFELEAMEKLESRQELDELTEAYRSSLLIHLFEKQLIENQLDSLISQSDLQAYYEDNKSQYVLQSSIVRLHFINIRKDHSELNEIAQLWKSHERRTAMDSLIDLCHTSAAVFLLEDSSWYKLEELKQIVPGNILKNRSNTLFKEQTFTNDTATFFLRVLEQIPDTEIAPLSFIEKQARKVILYRRKQKLIRNRRNELYEEAVKSNRIKLY